MLVTVVAVGRPDGLGLDLDRLEKVEDLDPEIAQKMLDGGTGRVPSEAELKAYHDARQAKDNEPAPGSDGEASPVLAEVDAETSNPRITPLPASE
jgi:hypothetical protein